MQVLNKQCVIPDCPNEAIWSGKGRRSIYCSEACKQKAKRVRNEVKRVKRLREQRSKLYVVPISLNIANAFVKRSHRHNDPVVGSKFNLAVIDETGLLRGVVIVGRPVARYLDNGWTLEVNRVATDGCPNSCSALYGAARKVAFDMGYSKVITYTLQMESGSSMRGAGWIKVAESEAATGKGWHTRQNRKDQKVYALNKWRWETVNPEYTRNKQRPVQIIFPQSEVLPEYGQLDMFDVDK